MYFDKLEIIIISVMALEDQNGNEIPIPWLYVVKFGTSYPNHFYLIISALFYHLL